MNTFKFVLTLFGITLFLSSCSDQSKVELPNGVNPRAFNTEAQGCSSFYVFKEDHEENILIEVQGSRDELELSQTEKEFDLTHPSLRAAILKFDGPIGQYACDDVLGNEGEVISTWKAISGKALIKIEEDRIVVNSWSVHYRISVKLLEPVFENEDGDQLPFNGIIEFNNVYVGWLPG